MAVLGNLGPGSPARPAISRRKIEILRAAEEVLDPNSEIRTADFADFTDVKRVSFRAPASDFEAIFVSKSFFIRAIRAICGFNSDFRVE
jgi:hypothetical protein